MGTNVVVSPLLTGDSTVFNQAGNQDCSNSIVNTLGITQSLLEITQYFTKLATI